MDPQRALLSALREDLEQAEALYRPTQYWEVCSRRLIADLETHGFERFRAMPAALAHFVPTYVVGGGDGDRARALREAIEPVLAGDKKAGLVVDQALSGRAAMLADYRVYTASYEDRRPFTAQVSESEVGEPVGQFTFEGRRFSRSMLNYLLGLEFVKKHVADLAVDTVLEIGGGFGTLGEILRSDPRNQTLYVDVDIPPTAAFSTYYLQQVLGADRVVDYTQTRGEKEITIDSLRSRGDAAVLAAWQLPRLRGSVDLFVNFISFQEMEPGVVQNYLAQVARLQTRYVLLRNLREEMGRSDKELSVKDTLVPGDYDRFLPDYELVAVNTVPFGHWTPDDFHSELRLYKRK